MINKYCSSACDHGRLERSKVNGPCNCVVLANFPDCLLGRGQYGRDVDVPRLERGGDNQGGQREVEDDEVGEEGGGVHGWGWMGSGEGEEGAVEDLYGGI